MHPTSMPSEQPSSVPSSFPSVAGWEESDFFVVQLSEDNVQTLDISSLIGVFNGNLGVSSSKIFVSGDQATISLPKNNFSLSLAVSSLHSQIGSYMFVNGIGTGELYAVGDEHGEFLSGPGFAGSLIHLDPDTALRSNRRIVYFTEIVFLSYQSGIYAGFNRVVIVDKVWNLLNLCIELL